MNIVSSNIEKLAPPNTVKVPVKNLTTSNPSKVARLPKFSSDEAKAYLEQFRQDFLSSPKSESFSLLLMGLQGSGKTTFITTGRAPILIDGFDPNGYIVLKDHIEAGTVIYRPFWDDDFKHPTQYRKWEKIWKTDLERGIFDQVGTYAIDSISTFIEALSNAYSAEQSRSDGKLEIQDYPVIYNMVETVVKTMSVQACDFVSTGHLIRDTDQATGEVVIELDIYKKLKTKIPRLFSEKYVMLREPKVGGTVETCVITDRFNKYLASNQLGKGKFKVKEEPNLASLVERSGLRKKV